MKKIWVVLLSAVFVLTLFTAPKASAAANFVDAQFYVDTYSNSKNGLQGFIINRGNRTLTINSINVSLYDANNNTMLAKTYNFPSIKLTSGQYHKFSLNAPHLIDRQQEMTRYESYIQYEYSLTPTHKSGTYVYVNGKKLSPDVPPANVNGRVLVPLRSIFEALGASVNWDSKTNTITAYKKDIGIKLTHKIGQKYMIVNGEKVAIDVSSQVVKGRTMVPVRAISNAFGVNVEYVQQDKVKYITVLDIYGLSEK
ncbi:copper amine oxidase N-terminal domain-containing protein [Bacillus sp. E(2018)]|uniref:copper amine oxidase N-terminal domain-containing protein n=1 Tax=Bacillus sp. E(2018) TaxID=2502239 RepID=UPI0010F65E86|nr:copper amine oxidase N-terminal domain-containing protein [Bacillus sp. E(2018)]